MRSAENYKIVAPISIFFALLAVLISILIITIVLSTKHLHTATHLLICNTSFASILYCIVQCNNYSYVLFFTWDTSDQSCRWRGYFGYLAMIACVYCYLLQVLSRFLCIIFSREHRWLSSLKIHWCAIAITWLEIFALPLPAILTDDIYFREGFLCWVSKRAMLDTPNSTDYCDLLHN